MERLLPKKEYLEPWEENPHIWATKASFFNYLRGALRRGIWERYPVKLEFKNENVSPPPEGYTGKARSGAECSLTGVWCSKSSLEVDHKVGNVSLQGWEDVLPFIKHLCATKDSLQLVSKEAHKIKSYGERMGLSFEEAVLEKEVIAVMRSKKDKEFIIKHNKVPASNAKLRREQVREILKGGLSE